MSQIDTVLRQVEVMRKALVAKGSGALGRVLSIYGERSPTEIKAMINQHLAYVGMDYDEMVEAGIDGEIRLVYLKWIDGRNVSGQPTIEIDVNHQSAGPPETEPLITMISGDELDQIHSQSPLLPPSSQQTIPGDLTFGSAASQSVDIMVESSLTQAGDEPPGSDADTINQVEDRRQHAIVTEASGHRTLSIKAKQAKPINGATE